MHGVFIAVCGLSLVEASEGFSLAAVHRLLTVVAYLVAHAAELFLVSPWLSFRAFTSVQSFL